MASRVWSVRAEGLGKEYVLGEHTGRVGRGSSLYEVLGGAWDRLRRRQARSRERSRLWALRDVAFEVPAGEVLGIVGRNGAGKSTLLKILSRITAPTEGWVELRGNVASLLEVGTGFHPELTGRENVFLNGTILGMRRREIERKFDAIVAFAEVERFVDTPVKRYSSGMYVRLAFAVAAHLDADILLVDEVLSVGDIAFQKKSLGKMEEVAGSGRTVLFVSHNLGAVRSLCSTVLTLERGRLEFLGPTAEGLDRYEATVASELGEVSLANERFRGSLVGRLELEALEIRQHGRRTFKIDPTAPFEVLLSGRAFESFKRLEINLGFTREGVRVFSCHDTPGAAPLDAGAFTSTFEIPGESLRPGRWIVGVGAYQPNGDWMWGEELAVLEATERWSEHLQQRDTGLVRIGASGRRGR